MSQFNLMDLCRLCLDKDRVSIPIFEGEGVVKKLYMKIGACLPVKVSETDRLPKKICDDCIYKVDLVYSFWNTTANAEKQLLSLLGDADSPQVPLSKDSVKTDNEVDVRNKMESNNLSLSKDPLHQGSSANTLMSPTSISQGEQPSVHLAAPNSTDNRLNESSNQSQEEEEESDEESDDGQYSEDEDDPAAIGEEGSNYSTLEPTFVSVDLMGEAGPSGLQQDMEAENMEGEEMSAEPSATQPDECKLEVKRSKVIVERKACEFCGKSFPVNYLPQHLVIHSGERPYQCKVCSLTFPYEKSLRSHMVSHSDIRPYCCDVCQRRFKRNNELTMHRKIHLGEKAYVCNVCGYSCVQKSNLVIHQKRHSNEYKLQCDICDKGCYTNQELQKHKMSHLDIVHKCKICGMEFVFKYGLTVHEKKHDPNYKAPVGKHQCELCGKTYVKKGGLKLHMRHHTGVKLHTCDVCGKSVSSRGTLEVHYRMHTGEKPNICEVCGKAFSSRRYLVTHMRSHTGEKPYSCKQCGKCFTQQSTLIVHQRYHTGCRPYECTVCHKGFVLKAQLKSHQKSLNHYPPPDPQEAVDEAVDSLAQAQIQVQAQVPGSVSPYMPIEQPVAVTCAACPVCNELFMSKAHLAVHQKETYHYFTPTELVTGIN